MKKAFFTGLKVIFFGGIFLFIVLTVLTKMGGQSEVMRDTVEDYITQNTPYTAHVGKLNGMYFFPDITVDIGQVELRNANQQTAITANRMRMSFAFFDLLFSKRRFRDVRIENLVAGPGILLSRALIIQQAGIESVEGQYELKVDGYLGDAKFSGSLGLLAEGTPSRQFYSFQNEWPVNIELGSLYLRGQMQKVTEGDLRFSRIELGLADQNVLSGDLDLNRLGNMKFNIEGVLQTPEGRTVFQPRIDVQTSPYNIRGSLSAEKLTGEDFNDQSPLNVFVKNLVEHLTGIERANLWGVLAASNLDIFLDIKNYQYAGIPLGEIKAPIKSQDYILSASPIEGTILEGDLKGEINLNIQKPPFKYFVDLSLDNASLNHLIAENDKQEALQNFDLRIHVTAESDDINALQTQAALGQITLVGNNLTLSPTYLNEKAEGFQSGMLPGLQNNEPVDVSCLIADFDIADHKAQATSIYASSPGFVLRGNGAYDILNDEADFVLEGRADMALDNAEGLHVLGPLANLKVKVARFDAGGSGLSSSAFNAGENTITLKEMALPADHPCRSVVIEQEILAPVDEPLETQSDSAETPAPQILTTQ